MKQNDMFWREFFMKIVSKLKVISNIKDNF